MGPRLLSLHGRIDHRVLEDAVAEVRRGVYPDSRLVRDVRRDGGPGWRQVAAGIASLVFGMFNQPASGPTRTIVLEHIPARRQISVVFAYLGDANGLPLWSRA